MSSKFAQKFNIAIRRAEEMINEERRHNEARHNEARKDLAFWQQQDLSHDYRETTSFEHELLNAIVSRNIHEP